MYIDLFQHFRKPSVALDDYNSHMMWGYDRSDDASDTLEKWIGSQDLHLIQDLIGPSTYWSARWNSGYNPNLTLVSLDTDGILYPATRTWLTNQSSKAKHPKGL